MRPQVLLGIWLAAAAGCSPWPGCGRPARPGEPDQDAAAHEPVHEALDAQSSGEPAQDASDEPDADLGEAPPIPPIEADEGEVTASAEEWSYLTDLEHTEKVLAGSPVAWGKSRVQAKTMLRMGEQARAIRFKIVLDPEEGGDITAQYKVRQTDFYFEWKREILGYALGKRIHAPVVPAIERQFPRKPFDRFAGDLTEEDYALIAWQGTAGGVRGSLRYWVSSLLPRQIGTRVCDEDYMTEIASALHPANREALTDPGYTVYLEMGRAIVLDYLILNDDRARNMGTVTSPDGVRHLILIDNGLAFGLESSGRTKAMGYFDAMSLFPRDTIEALRDLTEEEVMAIVLPEKDKVLSIKDKAAAQLWERRNAILERVDERFALHGDRIYY